MIKKSIYPKTKRLSCTPKPIVVTEKMDGSNLCFFKKDNTLHIAQRNTIFTYDEVEQNQKSLYKGLYNWLKENYEALNSIRENAVVCGEWMGMGKLSYPQTEFDKRFYMFAKANIDEDMKLHNMYYDHELFIFPFENNTIPDCIGVVPVVTNLFHAPSKEELDQLYEDYTAKKLDRKVEGFVVNQNNSILKYVRMKNGKLSDHFDRGN